MTADFAALSIRDKLEILFRETCDGKTNEFIAFKYGLGNRQRVTQYLGLRRLLGSPEGNALLDAIDKKWISFDKVREKVKKTISDEECGKRVEALLKWAAANQATGEQVGRGRNPFPERDGRSRRNRR